MTPSKPAARGHGPEGAHAALAGKRRAGKVHWITVRTHSGKLVHVPIAGPRPAGRGKGKFASAASAKGALTRGVHATNPPAATSPHAVERVQGQKLAGTATTHTMQALRGRATRGAKTLNAAATPRPTHPTTTQEPVRALTSSEERARGLVSRQQRATRVRDARREQLRQTHIAEHERLGPGSSLFNPRLERLEVRVNRASSLAGRNAERINRTLKSGGPVLSSTPTNPVAPEAAPAPVRPTRVRRPIRSAAGTVERSLVRSGETIREAQSARVVGSYAVARAHTGKGYDVLHHRTGEALTLNVTGQNRALRIADIASRRVHYEDLTGKGASARLAQRAAHRLAGRRVGAAPAPTTAPTHPTAAPAPQPRAPRATDRGTPERAAFAESLHSARKIPDREFRALAIGQVRAAAHGTAPLKTPRTPKPTAAPTHPSVAPAPTPKARPIVPRGTPERRAVAGRIKAERRGPDTDARAERLAALKVEARTTHDRQVKALPVHAEHLDRVTRAFDDLAQKNTVPLDQLRSHPLLAGLSRPEQDAAIHHLRLRDVLTLNSHEGRARPLSRAEIKAAIREGPRRSLLVFVSRRDTD